MMLLLNWVKIYMDLDVEVCFSTSTMSDTTVTFPILP